ncbi:MAG: pyruvate, phosphate dikinase [Thermotogae bacterium]|nr:pyruvate, phosphate dikinase [Thermotogota bacterium]
MAETKKRVFFFGDGVAEGYSLGKDLLGGKGHGLHEMTHVGLPVPPGFTITTEVCRYYYEHNRQFPPGLEEEVLENLKKVEKVKGQRFGDPSNPLLVSVRSGAPVSMPGMMDTILNLGLNDKIAEGFAKLTGERSAYDSYRRFLQMFAKVVLKINEEKFARKLDEIKARRAAFLISELQNMGLDVDALTQELDDPKDSKYREVKVEGELLKKVAQLLKIKPNKSALKTKVRELLEGKAKDTDLTTEDLKELVTSFKEIIRQETGDDFPQDPYTQLWMAIKAVFDSWNNPRAIEYRKIEGIPDDLGTACNVVAMVFGNLGDDSGTGVMFTRDPNTGEKRVYGEFLPNAQGEDIVAGIRTPMPLSKIDKTDEDQTSLEEWDLEVYEELLNLADKLEKYYRDMQDIEFTIERRRIWLLQTRRGKRTPRAEVKIAVDMAKENLIDRNEAILRVDPYRFEKVLHPYVDEKKVRERFGYVPKLVHGIPASPGAATGKIVFDPERAHELASAGEDVILVRRETSPEDIKGMAAAKGILTGKGGALSHAAVVARGMGKPAVVGVETVEINEEEGYIKIPAAFNFKGVPITLGEGDVITIDGGSGIIYLGDVPKEEPKLGGEVAELLMWADEVRRGKLGVRANADTPKDARKAREFGAEGIGLARTEHMFFSEDRIRDFRTMILLASRKGERYERAKERIKNYQREDFYGLLKEMDGLPVIIRLLDPPLHEFLPTTDDQIRETARYVGIDEEEIRHLVETTEEANPMLGHRGVRLAITYPDIYAMQVEAVAEAYLKLKEEGYDPKPKIMLPLVGFATEMKAVREIVERTLEKYSLKGNIEVGTMIELPRAALCGDEIALYADFFSFGTNDLTQTTLGFSRDDAGKFLPEYIEKKLLTEDPFKTVDDAVAELVATGTKKGKRQQPDLEVGVCGEHGGDPKSIRKFYKAGVDYVSASPFRVPVARLSAAQAVLGN